MDESSRMEMLGRIGAYRFTVAYLLSRLEEGPGKPSLAHVHQSMTSNLEIAAVESEQLLMHFAVAELDAIFCLADSFRLAGKGIQDQPIT